MHANALLRISHTVLCPVLRRRCRFLFMEKHGAVLEHYEQTDSHKKGEKVGGGEE